MILTTLTLHSWILSIMHAWKHGLKHTWKECDLLFLLFLFARLYADVKGITVDLLMEA